MPAKKERRHGYLSTMVYTITEDGIKSTVEWSRQEREMENAVNINRYKYNAIDEVFKLSGYDDADIFWEDFSDTLKEICASLSVKATAILRELIAAKAYTSVVIDPDTNRPSFFYEEGAALKKTFVFEATDYYLATGEFVNAWDVVVSLTNSLRSLRFNIIYNYNSMSARPTPWPALHWLPIHQSFSGEDYRRALADTLNKKTPERAGGWQETFDRYCHGAFYEAFKRACKKKGIIDE